MKPFEYLKVEKAVSFIKRILVINVQKILFAYTDVNGKRIASITHLYENTQILIKWLEQSGEVVKNVNNVFYEYDTDKWRNVNEYYNDFNR